MKRPLLLIALLGTFSTAHADVAVDIDAFGESLGGWLARKGKAAEYEISEAGYRTYQPEISPSPDGGIFISVRIDHRRGFFASDDHASLELSFASNGDLVSAQSSLALQGRTISSELIKGGASASTSVAAPQIERAVKVGTDLVADLSSKLLREKIVEPGRVSFPAAIRHNYNLLYKAVKYQEKKPESTPPETAAAKTSVDTPPATGTTPPQTPTPATPASTPPTTSGTPAVPPSTPATPASAPATTPTEASKVPAPPPAAPTAPKDAPAPAKAPPPPAPGPSTSASATTTTPEGKKIPLPDIKAYNPSGAPSTPLPASSSTAKKEKSLLMEHGDEVLKLARDVVKTTAK